MHFQFTPHERPDTTINWAKGILPDGRPDLVAGREPSEGGTKVCRGLAGGHNWQATATARSRVFIISGARLISGQARRPTARTLPEAPVRLRNWC